MVHPLFERIRNEAEIDLKEGLQIKPSKKSGLSSYNDSRGITLTTNQYHQAGIEEESLRKAQYRSNKNTTQRRLEMESANWVTVNVRLRRWHRTEDFWLAAHTPREQRSGDDDDCTLEFRDKKINLFIKSPFIKDYINMTEPLKPSITIPGSYYFDYTYPVPASLLIRGNNTFFMSIYQSVSNGQTFVNSSTVWILLNQSYSAIYVYPYKSSVEYDATLNASLTIICSAYPIPAPRISLTRRSSGLVLNSTENSRLLTFTLTSFNCLDTDEYVCLVDNGLPDVPNATSSIGIYGSSCGVQLQDQQANQQKIQVKPGSDVLVSIQVISRDNPNNPLLTRYVGGNVFSVPEAFYSTQYILTSKYYGKLNLALYHVTEDELSDYTVSINDNILYNFTLADESSINYQNLAIGVGVAAIGVICVTIVVALVCYYRNVRSSRLRSEDTRLTVYDVRETSTNYKEDYLEPTVNRSTTNSDYGDDSVYTDNNGLHKFGDQESKPRQNVYHHSPNRMDTSSGVVEPGEMYGNVLTPGDTSPVNDTDQPLYSNM
ncbi:uncharacterized protein LOC131942801 [Physella acuta]|uniref:uncharacterized protein LOC131942801 n=1 Tax=Physella acuta TaxID=109671 RepID=UPI0027DE4AC2|nr:uncharacterized protein LOC131942801 [Physella acuta]